MGFSSIGRDGVDTVDRALDRVRREMMVALVLTVTFVVGTAAWVLAWGGQG